MDFNVNLVSLFPTKCQATEIKFNHFNEQKNTTRRKIPKLKSISLCLGEQSE